MNSSFSCSFGDLKGSFTEYLIPIGTGLYLIEICFNSSFISPSSAKIIFTCRY